MDKRLLLALTLSVAILFGWNVMFPPARKPAPDPTQTQSAGARGQADARAGLSAGPGSQGAAQVVPEGALAPARGSVVEDTEERTFDLVFGSDPHRFRAVFSNVGGTLVELRMSGAFDHAGLSDEERLDPEHWVAMCEPFETPTGTTRSMALAADTSGMALLRGKRLEEALWTSELLGSDADPRGVVFRYAPGSGVRLEKRFLFESERVGFVLEIVLANEAAPDLVGPRQFLLTPAACMPANSGDKWWKGREPQAVAAGIASGAKNADVAAQTPGKKGAAAGALKAPAPLSYAGTQNKYFAFLVSAANEVDDETLASAEYRKLYDEVWARETKDASDSALRQVVTDVVLALYVPEPGRETVYRYDVYSGPKNDEMEAADPQFMRLLEEDQGMFSLISGFLLVVLRFFQSIVGNWGVAIILLTISVRGVLFPINRRSQTAMSRYQAKMKRLQPKIDALKEKYKNDAQGQRQAQAKLMQEEKAFPPLGGCLPMFLQLPVFFGLYRALGSAYELRQAPFFGWIKDLSLPDRLLFIDFDTHLPIVGTIDYLNVLPILMVVMWVLQQRGMPTPADEQAAKMQKMMTWMPVMMGFFLYNYAAGLSLYVITQSTLGLFEQRVIKKYWPVDDTEPAAKEGKNKKKGWFGTWMERVTDAQKKQLERMDQMKRSDQRRRRGGEGRAR